MTNSQSDWNASIYEELDAICSTAIGARYQTSDLDYLIDSKANTIGAILLHWRHWKFSIKTPLKDVKQYTMSPKRRNGMPH